MERTIYSAEPMSALHGKTTRYGIVATREGRRSQAVGASGRLLSFATYSGAIRRADQLNADEHRRITAK